MTDKNEKIEVPDTSVKKKIVVADPMYRMNLYRSNGQVRSDIPKGVLYELSRDWGDIIKVIPANRFSTLEEIIQMVWEWEKRQFRKSFTRTRKQIEDGVASLLLGGLLEQK